MGKDYKEYITLSMKVVPKRKATVFDNCGCLADIQQKAESMPLILQEMELARDSVLPALSDKVLQKVNRLVGTYDARN